MVHALKSSASITSPLRCWAYRHVLALRHCVWPHSFCGKRWTALPACWHVQAANNTRRSSTAPASDALATTTTTKIWERWIPMVWSQIWLPHPSFRWCSWILAHRIPLASRLASRSGSSLHTLWSARKWYLSSIWSLMALPAVISRWIRGPFATSPTADSISWLLSRLFKTSDYIVSNTLASSLYVWPLSLQTSLWVIWWSWWTIQRNWKQCAASSSASYSTMTSSVPPALSVA